MFLEIVRELETGRVRKTVLHQMASIFESNLPDSLYLNHYQLSTTFGFTHTQWNDFLKIREVNQIVESEIAQIAEIGARYALERLQSGEVSSQDIQAAKELLANSKLLKQKTNQRPQVIITRVPAKEGVDGGE